VVCPFEKKPLLVIGRSQFDKDERHEAIICSCNDDMQVKTLFISGLPMDTRPRELYLLCRSFKVY